MNQSLACHGCKGKLEPCLGPSLSPLSLVTSVGQWPRYCSLQGPSYPSAFFGSSLIHHLPLTLLHKLQLWLQTGWLGCFTTQPQGNISKNNLLDWRCLPAFYKIAKHYHDSCCYCQFNLKNIKKTLSHFKNRSLPKWQFLLEYTMRGQQQWLSEAFNIKETFLPNVHYAIKTRFLKSKSDYIKKLSTMKTNACIVNI